MAKGLYHKRGDTFRMRISARDGQGTPIDFAGCSAAMAWTINGIEAARISTADGGLVILPTPAPEAPVEPELEPEPHPDTGIIEAEIGAETTAALALGTYSSDLEIIWSDGSVSSSETILIVLTEDHT